MRYLELTDFWGSGAKEYVNVDDISRIESGRELHKQSVSTTVQVPKRFWLFSRKVAVPQHEDLCYTEYTGAIVYMKGSNKNRTYVSEKPEEIMAMLKEKKWIEIEGEISNDKNQVLSNTNTGSNRV